MSVRTRVDAPRRNVREPQQRVRRESHGRAPEADRRQAHVEPRRAEPAPPRRVEQAERVKSGAAQRAYARRRNRDDRGPRLAPLPGRAASAVAGRLSFVSGVIALLGCGLVATLLLTTRAAEDSYQLGDARQANRQLEDERAGLQREVAAADSAPELANRARELGMVPADDPARLVVAPDGAVTVIGAETPEQGPPAPPLNTPPPSPRSGPAQGERLVAVPNTPAPGQPPAATNVNQVPAPGDNPVAPIANATSPESAPNAAAPDTVAPDAAAPDAAAPDAAVPTEAAPAATPAGTVQ